MTQRDRKASARIHDALPQEKRAHPGSPSPELIAAASTLERIFQNAAPEERERLLALARAQGLVFSHQLPSSAVEQNGSHSPLSQFLSGRHKGWSPLRPQPVEPQDSELDSLQREAVAKALQTPDLCLIQGLPGTGKRRVAAEIIRQVAARGERVLCLAPRIGAIDFLLGRLASSPNLLPVRCLNRDESPERLPPHIRRLTFAEQLSTLKDQAGQQARREATAATARLDRCRRLEPLWTRLQEVAEALAKLAVQELALKRRRESLTDAVDRDATGAETNGTVESSFQTSLIDGLAPLRVELARVDGAMVEVRTKIAALERDRQEREALLTPLRPLVEAKRCGRWWTLPWWRATFSGKQLSQVAQLDAADQLAQTTLDKRNLEAQELLQEQERIRAALLGERSRRIEAETKRRLAESENEEAGIGREKAALAAPWADIRRQLGLDPVVPDSATAETVRQAYIAWQVNARREAEQAQFARDWAEVLQREAHNLDRYLLNGANIVAATTSTLAADEHFGDSAQPPAQFDILLLLDAQELGEPEIVRLARRANRVVMIGEAAADPKSEGSVPRGSASGVAGLVAAPRSGMFERLWNTLHCDPRRLPYSWFREGERLCCRLRPTTAEQRRWIEKESVADFPEIELRILAQPRKSPVLVEVLFPLGYFIQQAKEYILRELEESPISASGASIRWDEQPDRIVLRLVEPELPHSVTVALEPGVREMVAAPAERQGVEGRAAGWHTCCVEFERSAGWRRESVEEWAKRRLGLVDYGRSARLDHPYRMQPDLALFLSHLLFDGQYQIGQPRNGELRAPLNGAARWGPSVEFVPVAAQTTDNEIHSEARRDTVSKRSSKPAPVLPAAPEKCAGLEISLADPVQRNTLPEPFRAGLPRGGFVNMSEGRAVVLALESLIHSPAFRDGARGGGRPKVGVVALYSGQVELIRRLINQSPTLSAADVDFPVADPEAFRDDECSVMLLSLTRSPGHRVASLGEGPHRLIWCLTRATDKVLIFGDPGALRRRCQWDGPVESLDHVSSRREREILARLVQYLNGTGPYPHAFHLREGSWA